MCKFLFFFHSMLFVTWHNFLHYYLVITERIMKRYPTFNAQPIVLGEMLYPFFNIYMHTYIYTYIYNIFRCWRDAETLHNC